MYLVLAIEWRILRDKSPPSICTPQGYPPFVNTDNVMSTTKMLRIVPGCRPYFRTRNRVVMMAWRVYLGSVIGRFNSRVNEIQPEGGQAAQPINQRSEQWQARLKGAIKSIKTSKEDIQSKSSAKFCRFGSSGLLCCASHITMHKDGTT